MNLDTNGVVGETASAVVVVIMLAFLLMSVLEVPEAYPQENEVAVYDAGIAEFKKIIKQQGWEKADIYIASFCDQDYAEDFYHDLVLTRINFLHRRGVLNVSPQGGRYIEQLENIRDEMPDPEMGEGVADTMQSQCNLEGR